jgi:hypothetical protein
VAIVHEVEHTDDLGELTTSHHIVIVQIAKIEAEFLASNHIGFTEYVNLSRVLSADV